jgi:hypothetical protein
MVIKFLRHRLNATLPRSVQLLGTEQQNREIIYILWQFRPPRH